jgi:hypothetical protein
MCGAAELIEKPLLRVSTHVSSATDAALDRTPTGRLALRPIYTGERLSREEKLIVGINSGLRS